MDNFTYFLREYAVQKQAYFFTEVIFEINGLLVD